MYFSFRSNVAVSHVTVNAVRRGIVGDLSLFAGQREDTAVVPVGGRDLHVQQPGRTVLVGHLFLEIDGDVLARAFHLHDVARRAFDDGFRIERRKLRSDRPRRTSSEREQHHDRKDDGEEGDQDAGAPLPGCHGIDD
jgi:hypothetical protein